MQIDAPLVRQLISQQFPQWANLTIRLVAASGWDNRTFHLGECMSVRLPSDAKYASQVEKEQYWLPKLQPYLPLTIPKPVAMDKPTQEYPWHWSIFEWLEGEMASNASIADMNQFARSLASFLKALQHCDTTHAPVAGPDNFYRGGPLNVYDNDTRMAIAKLDDNQQAKSLTAIWEKALASRWQKEPVWVHGDIAIDNLLVNQGELRAVIDFGQLAVGDPACDLALYWTFLSGESQNVFQQIVDLDANTWNRARGWALWKTLCAPVSGTDCENVLCAIAKTS